MALNVGAIPVVRVGIGIILAISWAVVVSWTL
jgi:hypothetical protein